MLTGTFVGVFNGIFVPGGISPPDTFTVGMWSVADKTIGGTATVTISSLPDSEHAITRIDYRVDGGAWTDSGITTTDSFDISGLTDDVEVTISLRAASDAGNGPAGDGKAVTPTLIAVPDAFTVGMWSVADKTTGGTATVTISTLPASDSTITQINYRIDGGAWTDSGIADVGTFDISGLTDDVEVSIELQAVSAVGGSTASDSKAVTPTLAGDADVAAIVAAMTTPPDAARELLIEGLVGDLKTAGIWDKLDCLYVMAAADAQAAGLNWINPAAFALSPQSSPTFTADSGYAGDGSTSYLNSGWDPDTDGVNFAGADMHVFAKCAVGPSGATQCLVGTLDGSIVSQVAWNFSTGHVQTTVAASLISAVPSSLTSLFTGSATSASSRNLYEGPTSIANSSTAGSTLLSTYDFYILARNNAGTAASFSNARVSVVGWGASLAAGEVSDLNSAIATYLAGL
jgi:hypothetical protein